MPPHPIRLCTVGTRLFFPNLAGLKDQRAAGTFPFDQRPLVEAYRLKEWLGRPR